MVLSNRGFRLPVKTFGAIYALPRAQTSRFGSGSSQIRGDDGFIDQLRETHDAWSEQEFEDMGDLAGR